MQARVIDRVAASVKARDPIGILEVSTIPAQRHAGYRLKDRFMALRHDPPADLVAAVRDSEAWLLRQEGVEQYDRITPANPRLRQLLADTVEREQWKCCGCRPRSHTWSRALLTPAMWLERPSLWSFSSWVVVPDAIAAFCSYEANRLMLAKESDSPRYPGYSELHRSRARLLDFPVRDGRPGAMNNMFALVPKPGTRRDRRSTRDGFGWWRDAGYRSTRRLRRVKGRIRRRFVEVGIEIPADAPGLPDRRWYWAGPAMLDRKLYPDTVAWGWRSRALAAVHTRRLG